LLPTSGRSDAHDPHPLSDGKLVVYRGSRPVDSGGGVRGDDALARHRHCLCPSATLLTAHQVATVDRLGRAFSSASAPAG
jgi:hypothetical protein